MGYQAIVGLFIFSAALLWGIPACNTPGDPTPTPVTPQTILDAASERFATVDTAHYVLEIDGDVFLDDSQLLALRGAEGDLERPDRATAAADVSLGGNTVTINMVAIGDDHYMTNILTGRWERAPEGLSYSPAIIFDETRGIQGVLQKINEPEMAGAETVNGVSTRHIRGVVDKSVVAPMTGDAFDSDQIDVDLWIAEDDRDIVRIILRERPASAGGEPTTWTLSLTNQNKSVTIEPPSS